MSKLSRKKRDLLSKLESKIPRSEKKILRSQLKDVEKSIKKEKIDKIKSSKSYQKMKQNRNEIQKKKKNIQNQIYRLKKSDKIDERTKKKLEKLQKNQDFLNERMFRNSEKYFFLKRNQKKIKNRLYYISNKIYENDVDSSSELRRLKEEEAVLGYELLKLNELMNLPIQDIDLETGKFVTTPDTTKDQEVDEVLYKLLIDEVEKRLSTNRYKTVVIYDLYGQKEQFNFPDEQLSIIKSMNQLISEINRVRFAKKLGSPIIKLLYDNENNEIVIAP